MKNLLRNIIAICAGSTLLWAGCASHSLRGSKAQGENKSGHESTQNSVTTQGGSGQMVNLSVCQADNLNRILRVVDNVKLIESSHTDQPLGDNIRSKIDKEIDQIKEPRDLVTLALIFRAIESCGYGFEEAFWHCVHRLSDDPSDKAVDALNLLMQEVHPESGDKELFEEAISMQQREKKQHEKEGRP